MPLLAAGSCAQPCERPAARWARSSPPPAGARAQAGVPAADLAWQQFFGDARLQRLIGLALENNRDLRVAALRVERARAFYRIERTALLPRLNATGDDLCQRSPADLTTSCHTVTSSNS